MYEPETAPLSDYLKEPGVLLATLDNVQYCKLELVVARPIEGSGSAIYCLLRDWDRTSVGRVSQLEQITQMQQALIGRLQREAAELVQFYQAELATLNAIALAAHRTSAQVEAPKPAPATPSKLRIPATEPVTCATCGVFKPVLDYPQAGAKVPTRRGRVCKACVSESKKKQYKALTTTAIDDVPFTCPQCQSQAFTQALHRDVCVRCARAAVSNTGVSIAAAE